MVVNSVSRMLKRFQDHRDMNAVNLPLPESLLTNVKEFASDKLNAHPTAQLIKDLEFHYKPEENKYGWGVYRPHRLEVSSTSAHFIRPTDTASPGPHLTFLLTDFLPSYWSNESDTFDRGVYEREYINNWLRDSDWL